MNLCYKAQNFITAAHLARQILDLEPKGVSIINNNEYQVFSNKPELIAQYKKYYAAFQKKGTNQHKLSFNLEDCSNIEEANGNQFILMTGFDI